jgi:acid phosphatase class B
MQVTSIRLERSLIDKLKARAGSSGYQSLMRDILWNYVNAGGDAERISQAEIRTVIAAEARRQEQCALTGRTIEPYEEMWLAMTDNDKLVPLSIDSLDND